MRRIPLLLLALLLLAGISYHAWAWGFWAHRKINRMAVFTLPPAMVGFYKKNLNYITEQAVGPDKRRYAVEEEAPRHYIDIDHYGYDPFTAVPRRWSDAVKKYSEDTLLAYGIVPWWVDKTLYRLTEAFRRKDPSAILRLSADIGHYIADAHVPLHCTENYNGQMTGQEGIHAFWESRIPELYGDGFDYFVGRAGYIENPLDRIWEVVHGSFVAKDSVLGCDASLDAGFPPDRKYAYEQRGASSLRVHSREYCRRYNIALDDMVEKRMQQAILAVGSFWYTAWVNAGQPDLDNLQEYELTEEEKAALKDEDRMWRTGKAKNPKGHVE